MAQPDANQSAWALTCSSLFQEKHSLCPQPPIAVFYEK